MKKILIGLVLFAGSLFAQASASNVIGGGVFYNQYSTPQISGYLAYGVKIGTGTYSYTEVDITSVKVKPFTAQASSTTGIAQYVKTVGKIDVYAIAGAGAAVSGSNVGGAFTGGALLVTEVKNGWEIQLPVKVIKTSLSGTQYIIGIGIGWGK